MHRCWKRQDARWLAGLPHLLIKRYSLGVDDGHNSQHGQVLFVTTIRLYGMRASKGVLLSFTSLL